MQQKLTTDKIRRQFIIDMIESSLNELIYELDAEIRFPEPSGHDYEVLKSQVGFYKKEIKRLL